MKGSDIVPQNSTEVGFIARMSVVIKIAITKHQTRATCHCGKA